MSKRIWSFIRLILRTDLIMPLVLVLTYITFLVIVRRAVPTSEELIASFANLYSRYGNEIIFASAFLESLVLVNLFVPGTLAVALGVIFARAGHTDLVPVIVVAAAGALSGYCLNFLLGSFGFADVLKKMGLESYTLGAQAQLRKFGKRGLILGFVHPNIASFLSLVAGTANMGFFNFLAIAIPATIFWTTFWGLLIFGLGDIFLLILTKYSFLLVLISLAGLILGRVWKQDTKKGTP